MQRFTAWVVLGFIASTTRWATAEEQGLAVDRFDPSERGSDWFMGESLDLRGELRPAVGIVTDWAHDPVVLRSGGGSEQQPLIANSVYAHAGGALTLWNRLRIAVNVPIAVYQDGGSGSFDGQSVSAANGTAFGDVRAGVDVRLFGTYGDPVTAALGVQGYAPTGSRESYTSDGTFRAAPRLLVAGRIGRFVYSAHAAVLIRSDISLGDSAEGSELCFTTSAGVELLRDRLLVGPELYGSTTLNRSAFDKAETPLEGMVGAHFKASPEIRVGAGIAAGLLGGLGSPVTRLVASLEYAPGVSSPPPIRDLEPPPRILPIVMACPAGTVLEGGACVVRDRDGDGVADVRDACPMTPGVTSADPSRNGCPPPADADGDGIVDALDACPHEAGQASPDPKKNGCPKAVLVAREIRITDQIQFRVGRAEIDPASVGILEAVLDVLCRHPEIARLSIDGHTDNRGAASLNRALSASRAESVRRWLMLHGVDESRLESHGYGAQYPVTSNASDEGRHLNRRVEFHVLDSSKADLGALR